MPAGHARRAAVHRGPLQQQHPRAGPGRLEGGAAAGDAEADHHDVPRLGVGRRVGRGEDVGVGGPGQLGHAPRLEHVSVFGRGATDRITHTGRPHTEREVTLTFDLHQLDSFVLVGAAVTLLAILAVRVSSRAGLPSLLLYLLMGVALGEAGVGITFDDPQLAHALGFLALAVILAEGGLTTSWREVKPSMRLGGLAGDRRGGGLGDGGGRRRPLPARPAVGAGRAARCRHLADRRGGGVLGAAGGAAAPAADRRARGGVRPQRRTDRRAGDADLDRRRSTTTACSGPAGSSSTSSWSASRSGWPAGSAAPG